MIQRCTTCKASIIWRKHHISGKWAPIDAEPSTNGNIALSADGKTYKVLLASERASQTGPLYTNHFVTCIHAAEHSHTAPPSKAPTGAKARW